ncbi:protein NLRC3-like isoform X1 [Stylophora pistillata]|nr:protein NLRC3-like isoform X1 [Stylophora pistillata]XP_022804466.1 protein NLRC3-like isoform X1 [Stylophora pistillata]XP_022804467.1 protein NLRC3-like isoform X1 [Stylophora pistillata]XP_022804468.1 protein NLRC3-like isoform X1 [Stylophora pistillata]XP_022804469.1 protein NLRC3-like isoform X1 [Stylophora pistillata]
MKFSSNDHREAVCIMHDILQIQSNTDNAQQSDPSMDLQKTAADKGFLVCDNPASGDCMFYALSHQLQSTKGIEISHRQLRCDLVQFLERYPNLNDGTELYNFVDGYRSWFDYLRSMEKDGTWGDHLILYAAANSYKTCIRVISSLGHDVMISPNNPTDINTNPLVIGHIHERHCVNLLSRQESYVNQQRTGPRKYEPSISSVTPAAKKTKYTEDHHAESNVNQQRTGPRKYEPPISTVTPAAKKTKYTNDDHHAGSATVNNLKDDAQDSSGKPPHLDFELPDLKDLPTSSSNWSDIELPVEILLLTVEDCEFLACFHYLIQPLRSYHKDIGFVYFGLMGYHHEKELKIALVKCTKGSAVPGGSLTVVNDVVRALGPKAVFSVGACFGLTPVKTRLGDVVVSSKLTTLAHKVPPSRDIGNLIRYAADGWRAPLKDPKAREVKVNRDGTVLSIPWSQERSEDILQQHPEAIAVEMEGEGVFAAAHHLKTEWVVVKGIKGYASENRSSSDEWEVFASAMAASVVSNILRNPGVFQDWSHYNEDATEPINVIERIRQLYKTREGQHLPVPWCEDFSFNLNEIFTRLRILGKDIRGELKWADEITNMTAIFRPHEEGKKPRTVLIEGDPGIGKTTYSQKLAYDWATLPKDWHETFPMIAVLLLLRCHDIKSSLWEAIDEQLLPKDIDEDCKEIFFKFIRKNQSKVLIVLNGLDEADQDKLGMFIDLVQSKQLPKCFFVFTSRHDSGLRIRRFCDNLWEIVGFTRKDAERFIYKYFVNAKNLADRLVKEISSHPHLLQLTSNPLNAALLCILCEDFKGTFPESRTELFIEIVLCVLRRYEEKNGISSYNEDLMKVYQEDLRCLGRMALTSLLKGELYFDECRQKNSSLNVVKKFGLLSRQPGGSKRKPCYRYGFLHKSFQEFFAGFYLALEILRGETEPEISVTDLRFLNEFKEVFLFMTGIVVSRCKETSLRLLSNITAHINSLGGHGYHKKRRKEVNKKIELAFSFIEESGKHRENFQSQLLHQFGSQLCLETLLLKMDARLTFVFESLSVNTSLTELRLVGENRDFRVGESKSSKLSVALSFNTGVTLYNGVNIGMITDSSAASLEKALSANTTKLSYLNLIGFWMWGSVLEYLSKALTVNSTLTYLNLSDCQIDDSGIASLSRALSVNTALTKLDLSSNAFGVSGAASLSEALRVNSALTHLNLSSNRIPESGVLSFSQTLSVNTTLTYLSWNGGQLGASGTVYLSDALTDNETLTDLDLFFNGIGDSGVASLSRALSVNTTLTNLCLGCNQIGDSGADSLSTVLSAKTALTYLDLHDNKISDSGAASLSEALKANSTCTLTDLNLSYNKIGDTGAVFFSKALSVNTTSLTNLNLCRSVFGDLPVASHWEAFSVNRMGDFGAASLSEALSVNTKLTNLNLGGHAIGDSGAASLYKALSVNKTLTNLSLGSDLNWIVDNCRISLCEDFSVNTISDSGAASLSEALSVNTTLTYLDLRGHSIGASGVAHLSKALAINTALTDLNLQGNYICDSGAASLSNALLSKKTALTNLHLRDNSIGDSGVVSLSNSLKVNTTLTDLDLSRNTIGDSSANSLSKALEVNNTLTNLNLSRNAIGNSGANSLSKLLEVNNTLTHLNLSSNTIGESGGVSLSKALEVNGTLTHLDLSDNAIGPSGCASFSKALSVNTVLTNIELRGNDWLHIQQYRM